MARVAPAPLQIVRRTKPRVARISSVSDWLSVVLGPILNATQKGADVRQLACAGEQDVVPLIYGSDRIGAKILNVIPTGQYVIVQALWGLACDSINDLKYADADIPPGSSSGHHADGGSDSTFNAYYLASTGTTYTDSLAGYAWSWVALPVNAFTGFQLTARIRGRKCYDPRLDSTQSGGSGSHRLSTPSTWAWTDNPSLHLADFLYSTTYGCGKTVDWLSVMTAAGANDALVGGSEKRRTSGLSFLDSLPVSDIAETLRAHAGVFHSFTAAGIKLVPDAARTTDATYSHASGEIAELVSVEKKDAGDVPTVVEVLYTDTAAVPYRDGTAEAVASGVDSTLPRRTSQVRLAGVQRYSQASREAIERLNKLRTSDLLVTVDVFDKGIAHEPGDVIEVTHPVGLSAKKLRLTEHPQYQGRNVWRLNCAEYDPAAYSDSVVSGPTYPDTNLGMPNPDRQGLNLLRNPDWTEDVGVSQDFYPDARATPAWSFGRSDTHGSIMRNYNAGHQYNFGRGGICHYIPSYSSGEYCYSSQLLPVIDPDIPFEVSAYCQINHAQVILYGRALDAALASVQDFSASFDATSGVDGDGSAGYVQGNYRRLWCKVDVSGNGNKANVKYLQIMLLTVASASTGGASPFVAWQKAMVCRAPPDVTEATATAWVDESPSIMRGLGTPIEVNASCSDFNSIGYSVGSHSYFYHAATDPDASAVMQCAAGDRILIDVWGWVIDDGAGAGQYNIIITDALVAGGSGALFHDSGGGTGNMEIFNQGQYTFLSTIGRWQFNHQRVFVCPSSGAWTFAAMMGLDSSSRAGDIYIRLRINKVVT